MPWEYLYNFGYPAGPILTQAIAYSISRIRPRWIRTVPTSATVPAGGALNAEATFDATWIRGGPHDAVIRIQSNDPHQPEILLPAHLDVTPRPEIDLSRSILSFGSQIIGGSSLDTLVVSNSGTDVLVVTGVISSIADFTADVDSFRVAPGADRFVHVAFHPTR